MLNRSRLLCLLLASGCHSSVADERPKNVPSVSLRGGNWTDYRMKRPQRSALEVVERARAIGEIVLDDTQLPSPSLLDPTEMNEWTEAARKDPYREGALRFDLGGHDILVRYRPASDRLTVSTFGRSAGPTGTWTEPGASLGLDEAELRALECTAQLEAKGIIGPGEFSEKYHYASSRPTLSEASGAATLGRYSFVYHPILNGLPLLSSEVVVSVDANSGACRRITVSGQVEVERVRDSEIAFADEAHAQRLVSDAVTASAPGDPSAIHVRGEFGYYLPLAVSEQVVEPAYIASYAIETGTPEQPLLSRRRLVSLPLDSPEALDLVDLLGPDW